MKSSWKYDLVEWTNVVHAQKLTAQNNVCKVSIAALGRIVRGAVDQNVDLTIWKWCFISWVSLRPTGKVLDPKRCDTAEVGLKAVVDLFVQAHSIGRRRVWHCFVAYGAYDNGLSFEYPIRRRRLSEN